MVESKELRSGDVGYILASIRDMAHIQPGDTVTSNQDPCLDPLSGYKKIKPMVFSGLYPVDGDEYDQLRVALEKLKLNDASLEFLPETSEALGFGFRCGFLGLLHMEIIRERVQREYNLEFLMTVPSVTYRVENKKGEINDIRKPSDLPDDNSIKCYYEPIALISIVTPSNYLGSVIELCTSKRGIQKELIYRSNMVEIKYEIPLSEIIYDFFDILKSASKGYASYDYDIIDFRESKMIRLDIHVNKKKIDALSQILHKDNSYRRSRELIENLKKLIPRQNFEITIQGCVGSKILSSTSIRGYRKDVTAKLYGGDATRKMKLLKKQKEGKKKMKKIGNVEIPREAFYKFLSTSD